MCIGKVVEWGDGECETIAIEGTEACGGGLGQAVLGGIQPQSSLQITKYNNRSPGFRIGLIAFTSRLLRLFTFIIGGIFLLQMVYAGFLYLSSQGDTAVFNKFKETLYWSLIGLFVLAASYAIAALVGLMLFGDATFILKPQLYSAIPQ